MVDDLLQVLNLECVGKKLHAEEIRKVYHKKLVKYKRCGNCSIPDRHREMCTCM